MGTLIENRPQTYSIYENQTKINSQFKFNDKNVFSLKLF